MKQTIVTSLAKPVGNLWRNLQKEFINQGSFYVASPLSSTPLPIYEWIIKNAHTFSNWDKMKFVLMDEMLKGEKKPFTYVPITDSASYEGFVRKHLLEPLRKKVKKNFQIIKPEIDSIESFETPLDLLILALGIKGNYANAMPGTILENSWHIAHLIQEFRQVHTQKGSGSFDGANFREFGMSLGPQQVLHAKNIIVIISGEKNEN